MQISVTYDPTHDDITDVLDQICASYGTTLTDLASETTEELAAVAEDTGEHLEGIAGTFQMPVGYTGNWNFRRAHRYLELVSGNVREAIALLVVHGSVTTSEMQDYLGTDNLRGVFSGLRAAARKVRGLPDHTDPWVRRDGRYIMDENDRKIFRGAIHKHGTNTESLLVKARQTFTPSATS